MVRIDRAAWQRIKARMAEPRTVTLFKGRSVGRTTMMLENWADEFYAMSPPRDGETDVEFRARVVRRWQTITIDTEGRPIDSPRT